MRMKEELPTAAIRLRYSSERWQNGLASKWKFGTIFGARLGREMLSCGEQTTTPTGNPCAHTASPLHVHTDRDVSISEHVRCANETGVVGRFQQQIGHVMTCVGSDLDPNMHLYFGDWWDEVSCFRSSSSQFGLTVQLSLATLALNTSIDMSNGCPTKLFDENYSGVNNICTAEKRMLRAC